MTIQTEETKAVMGYFGKLKQTTRKEFVARWVSHATELYSVANSHEQYMELARMVANVEIMAGEAFDRIRQPA